MSKELDYPAIATFCAFGFFLDDDTFFTGQKFRFDTSTISGKWLSDFQNFKWHHDPEPVSLDNISDRFAKLLDEVIHRQVGNRHVILPLSGGLDSRTLAWSLHRLQKKVTAFSYRFPNGINETSYAQKIAEACGFSVNTWEVPKGYLWNKIDELSHLNHCYTDFTQPRQMAFIEEYKPLGDVFCLGHWGDVLFDGSGVPENASIDEQAKIVMKKITKKGGAQLAEDLWKVWGLKGTWRDYIFNRVKNLLVSISIDNSANARIRAFKSKYWATRWTAANFPVFEKSHPITAPYFDTAFCEFICKIPEQLLDKRQIQITYLRKYAPSLARITWQAQRPYNLFNYQLNTPPWNLPFRIFDKAYRNIKGFAGQGLIQRNWEIQFLGEENDRCIRQYLDDLVKSNGFIPEQVVSKVYNAFTKHDAVGNAHPLSMLLTLSLFSKNYLV